MIDSQQFSEALDLIDRADRILVTTHNKPDGDACGSLVVMRDALRGQGKRVYALLLSEVPAWYRFIASEPLLILGRDVQPDKLLSDYFQQIELVILLDVNSTSQLPHVTECLRQVEVPVLVIDHHATSDGLGSLELVDPTAAATGLLVYELLKYAQWPLTPTMAEALFVAAATDTGWFQFGNTDSRVYRDCAVLIEAGAQPKALYDKLYHNFSLSRFQLMLAMLNNLELHYDNQFALQVLRQSDFAQSGAATEDTENLINECHRIASIRASALLVELGDGRIRCSLRSRDSLDISVIANRFGGGGHKMAAGAFLPGPLEHARKLILEAFSRVFDGK